MIEKAEIHNFRSIRHAQFDLERLTVFVGPNGSGKTTALLALFCLSEFGHERSGQLNAEGTHELWRIWPAQKSRGAGTEDVLELMGMNGDAYDQIRVGHNGVELNGRSSGNQQHEWTRSLKLYQAGYHIPVPLSDRGPALFLHLEAGKVAAASYSDDPVPRIQPSGEGFASYLDHLISARPEGHEELVIGLRKVVPTVRAVRTPRARVVRAEQEVITVEGKSFTRTGEKELWGNQIEFDMEGATGVPASAVSEGTLLALAILAIATGPDAPRLLLLDDIDHSLHPRAQAELIARLRQVLDARPELQIVATSHSPYMLDHLRPEEVRLSAIREDGSTVIGRLDDHPDYDRWRDEMTPGEFWSYAGEDWLAGRQQAGST